MLSTDYKGRMAPDGVREPRRGASSWGWRLGWRGALSFDITWTDIASWLQLNHQS